MENIGPRALAQRSGSACRPQAQSGSELKLSLSLSEDGMLWVPSRARRDLRAPMHHTTIPIQNCARRRGEARTKAEETRVRLKTAFPASAVSHEPQTRAAQTPGNVSRAGRGRAHKDRAAGASACRDALRGTGSLLERTLASGCLEASTRQC